MKKTLSQKRDRSSVPATRDRLAALYEPDETAWLEESVSLIKQKRFGELDYVNLIDCLEAMAISQRREVKSRLTTLILHLLKWQYQPQNRTGGWEATILHQRLELDDVLASRTLKNHADEVLAKAYAGAVKMACRETGLAINRFPKECPYALDFLVSEELPVSDESD